MNKSLSVLIYALVWLVLVLVQSLFWAGNGPEAAFWHTPQNYYSLWMVDLYLIVLFYVNYYGIAPSFIRRRMFTPYIWLSMVFAVIGLMIPVVLYYAYHWSLPGMAPDVVPYSSLGVLGVMAVMAIGLAIRGVSEWVRLEKENKAMTQELANLRAEATQLRDELQRRPLPTTAKQPNLTPEVGGESFGLYKNL